MAVNLYTTKCLHPALITAGASKQDSPMQARQYYTAFPPGSRVISFLFSMLPCTRSCESNPDPGETKELRSASRIISRG